jgi:hypothetical protein
MLALALIGSASVLYGCSCGGTPASTSSPGTTTAATSAAAGKSTTAAASGSSVSSLLGKIAGIGSVKFDSITTGAGNPGTPQTVFLKKTKMRIETTQAGSKVVILIDQDLKVMYNYSPDQNSAIKMDLSSLPASAQDPTKIQDYNPVIVGTETIDGKVCTIVQFTNQAGTTKEWLWQDRGLPVKTETTTAAGLITTQNTNFSFSDIPDSTFQLPAGVKVSEFSIPTGLPTGLPTNLPTGLPTNLPTGLPTNLPTGLPK